MAVKPSKGGEYQEVTYDAKHWAKLRELRSKALQVMTALEAAHLQSIVHGSLARGDIKEDSDIDVFIPTAESSFRVEIALEKANIKFNSRFLVQATPNYAMKAHIEIYDNITVTFPLMVLRRVEREFYRFGGEANLAQLQADIRVAGVDKRLMLIEPTDRGHVESSTIGNEDYVARLLGISSETVLDRVHALVKRDSVGRTGVFIKRELAPDETFEGVLKSLARANPAVRRRIRG